MKKRYVLFIFIVLFGFIHSCFASERDRQYRNELVQILQNAIEINENFKNTVYEIPLHEQQKKRKKLEKYYEEVLSSRFKDYIDFIITKKDIELSILFFKMIISFQNSADERLAYMCGEIFLRDSNLFSVIFNKFTYQDQIYLYKQLEFGWKQILYTKDLSESLIVSRNKELKNLAGHIKTKGTEPGQGGKLQFK